MALSAGPPSATGEERVPLAALKTGPVAQADATRTFNPGAEVLLVQDRVPWFAAAGQDPRGADVTELKVRLDGKLDLTDSALVGVIDLTQYRVVVLASAQPQSFYDNVFPGGYVHSALVDWVEQGGILVAHLADHFGGDWDGRFFLQGVTKTVSFSQANGILAADHPIVTGEFGGPNGGPIVDVGPLEDLDDWDYSSHGWLRPTPRCKTVIFADSEGGSADIHKPVMVEFPVGKGTVIATMMTIEWRYVGDFGGLPENKKLLANELGYAFRLAGLV